MKLRQIEEIATKQVPIWQPVLLGTLLLLGVFVVPLIAKKTPPLERKSESFGSTLGVSTFKKQLSDGFTTGVNEVVRPLSVKLQKEAEKVLGIAQESVQQKVQDVASQSAEQAKEFVFDNTLGKVLQNIKTLPADQQDLIKKAICK
jgi:hypothetical protein